MEAWNQRRETRMSEPFARKPKKEAFTKLDFTAIVLQHRLLTPSSVPCLPQLPDYGQVQAGGQSAVMDYYIGIPKVGIG